MTNMKKHPERTDQVQATTNNVNSSGDILPAADEAIAAANFHRGQLVVDELIRCGVDYFVVSPGSRSTPLTAAVARNPRARSFMALDERAAAFHALGYARACKRAAVLLCTSGSALANYFPAVVEAFNDRVPLIILSADRPPELRGTGANQTMDQVKIFGDYARWWTELPCPDGMMPESAVRGGVAQLEYRSRRPIAGPVQMNCMFREPLLPDYDESGDVEKLFNMPEGADGRGSAFPATQYIAPLMMPPREAVEPLALLLQGGQRGILVVGRLPDEHALRAVKQLADVLNWPVFADVRSAARRHDLFDYCVDFYDRLLDSPVPASELRPDVILHLGDQLCSKSYLQWTMKFPPQRYIAVKDHPERHDPAHCVTHRLEMDIEQFCRTMALELRPRAAGDWTKQWMQYSDAVNLKLQQTFIDEDTLSEAAVANIVNQHLPQDHVLCLASSMPIRYFDMYCADTRVRDVTANRGVSGIDGTIATAGGYGAGARCGVSLLIGDLALIHDLNSLLHLGALKQPFIIVLLNNQGGGIFSLLPVARHVDMFETFFGTPHAAQFDGAAAFAGVEYFRVEKAAEFEDCYRSAVERNRTCLIEVQTNRAENAARIKQINAGIRGMFAPGGRV